MNVLALSFAALLVAQTAPAPAPTVDPLAYDDPGMHFRAPDGWVRLTLPPRGDESGKHPVAAYVFHPGKYDQRTIVIEIDAYDGSLEGLENSHESDLRGQSDGTFIKVKTKTALANGMPAYQLSVSQPNGSFGQIRRYEYLVYDLKRSIDVSYVGRYGDFSDDDAKAALASLYVVVYPRDGR